MPKNKDLNLLNNHILSLDSTLKICINNHKRLMDMCAKSKSSSTHYAHIYSKVYKCSNYGRKGHLSKFCYDAHKHKNANAPCASHVASSSQTHAHTHHVHHKHAHVFKYDICGRFGHLAKYCFDLRKVSKSQNISSRPTLF